MKVFPIETGNFKIDGGAIFGVVPKVLWQKKYPADENNLCNWAMRSLLVDTGDRRILFNNGMGDKQDEKFFSRYHPNGEDNLLKSLAKAGYAPEDITDNIITHLHYDHCGGGVKYNEDRTRLELTFKNADYWISKAQWELANNPNAREKAAFLPENFLPVQEHGKLKLVEENTNIFPEIEVRLYDGHTQGQLIPFIHHEGKTLMFVSDLLPSTAHVPLPYIMSYDTLPLVTLKEKEDFFKEAVEKQYILFFEHDLYNECCTLEQTPKGAGVKKTFRLSEVDF